MSNNTLYYNGGSYMFADEMSPPMSVKMEPVSPASSVSSSTNSSFGGRRKRNASQAALNAAAEAKKLKKYEMDPTDNPAVKNAIAAKANREKHKQEFMKLKTENQELKSQVDAKDKVIANKTFENEQLRREREELARQLHQVQNDYADFMRVVAFGEKQKAMAQSAIPVSNNFNNNNTVQHVAPAPVTLNGYSGDELETHGPGDQIQQLSQNTLDQVLETEADMGHSNSFPDFPLDEDFPNDPLMSGYKDYELPSTPEEYDIGYRQHDDLDQIENRRARTFTPPGG